MTWLTDRMMGERELRTAWCLDAFFQAAAATSLVLIFTTDIPVAILALCVVGFGFCAGIWSWALVQHYEAHRRMLSRLRGDEPKAP
jgi:hypothetical protein